MPAPSADDLPPAHTLAQRCVAGAKLRPVEAVEVLAGRPPEARAYACAREALLTATSAFPDLDSYADAGSPAVDDGFARATVTVKNRSVVFRVVARGWILVGRQRVGPFVFELAGNARTVRVKVSRANVPSGTRRVVTLHTLGLADVSAEPRPETVSDSTREWSIKGPGQKGDVALRRAADR